MENIRPQMVVAKVKTKRRTSKQPNTRKRSTINKSRTTGPRVDEAYSPTLSCYDHSSLFENYPDNSASTSSFPLNSLTSKEDSAAKENVDQNIEPVHEAKQKQKNSVATLAQVLTEELEDLSADIFFEAKWKIIEVLREAQTKNRLRKTQEMQNNLPAGNFRTISSSTSSSPSVIVVQSPIEFPISPELNSSTPQKEAKPSVSLSSPVAVSPTCHRGRSLRMLMFKEIPRALTFNEKNENSESAGT